MVFHVVSIEVSEELFEPLVHDLMVLPSVFELRQEHGSALACFVTKCWQHIICQVSLNRLAMALIKFAGPVVRRALGAHVVASSAENKELETR